MCLFHVLNDILTYSAFNSTNNFLLGLVVKYTLVLSTRLPPGFWLSSHSWGAQRLTRGNVPFLSATPALLAGDSHCLTISPTRSQGICTEPRLVTHLYPLSSHGFPFPGLSLPPPLVLAVPLQQATWAPTDAWGIAQESQGCFLFVVLLMLHPPRQGPNLYSSGTCTSLR